MKTNHKWTAITFGIATLIAVQASAQNQPSQPAPPQNAEAPAPMLAGPPAHPHRPHRGAAGPDQRPPRPRNASLTTLTTVLGTVGQWVGNDDAILDGFTLKTASGTVSTVKFPAHLGQQVQKAIKLGANVSVTGYSETGPQGDTLFRMTTLTAGKTTVTDSPPSPPTTAETPTLSTASGKIAEYRLDREGRVRGWILDNKTIVNIPPHVAYQLTELAKKGTSIVVQGYPKRLHDGQVQLEKINILQASVLTINGQQYLVR